MNASTACVCGYVQVRQHFSSNFDALHCGRCGSSHFVPKEGAAPVEFRYNTDNEKYTQRDYLYGKELRWAHHRLLAREWRGRKVLEIGCFNGFFLDELKKRGARVHGFDVNTDALEVGRAIFGLGDTLRSSLPELAAMGSFDDIICVDVVEHLDEPAGFLVEVSSMLAPSGRLIIAGPTLDRRFHDKSDYPPHHKWWFSREGLKLLLQSKGFAVHEVLVQRDGLLMLRNLIGKALNGLGKREFYGDGASAAPSASRGIGRHVYAAASRVGTALFSVLRISYCSAILIADRSTLGR